MLQREHWGSNEAKARYHILSEVLKTALDKKYVNLKDFHKTDEEVLSILFKTGEKKILDGLKKLKEGFKVVESNNEDSILLKKKFRYIDPEILVNNTIKRLSSVSEEYKDFIKKETEESKKVVYIDII